MAVKTETLQIPERDLDLANREGGDVRGRKREEALRERIARARELKPRLHCSHCAQAFADGRDAVLKVLEG